MNVITDNNEEITKFPNISLSDFFFGTLSSSEAASGSFKARLS